MLVLFGAIVLSILSSTAFGQDYTVYPKSIKECPVVKDDRQLHFEIGLKDLVDGSKSLSLTADLGVVLDDKCKYIISVQEKKPDGEFKYMAMNRGTICDMKLNNNPIWNRFKQEIDPPVVGCIFNSSTYSLGSFQFTKDDVNQPFVDGHYRTQLNVFCNYNHMTCVVGEVEIVED